MSDCLGLYEPTARKEGSAKQFIQMTQKATCVTLKIGQAAVQGKSNHSIEAQILIGQYTSLKRVLVFTRSFVPACYARRCVETAFNLYVVKP